MGERRADRRQPHQGDTIIDPGGYQNRVVMVRGAKLLLADSTGFQFILARHRLDSGRWRLKRPGAARPRRSSSLGRVPYIPRA